MKEESYDSLAKVILIGESGVGKTSILHRFCNNKFSTNHLATIAIDFHSQILNINNIRLKLQLWDTAGQERFNTLTAGYFRNSHGIFVVYDICDRKSFDNVNKWINQIKLRAPKTVKVILVGNKCDLEEERNVSVEEGKALATENGLFFAEVSAFSGQGVKETFDVLGGHILKDYTEKKPVSSLKDIKMPRRNNGCCK